MIYCDITMLLPGGRAVGITRILGELARAALQAGDLQFVGVEPETAELIHIEADEVAGIIDRDRPAQMHDFASRCYPRAWQLVRRVTPSRFWFPFAREHGRRLLRSGRRVRFTPDDIYLQIGLPLSVKHMRWMRTARESGARVLLYLHDLIPLLRPHYTGASTVVAFGDYLDAALDDRTGVITNSDCTRRDFEGWLEAHGKVVPFLETVKPAWELASAVPEGQIRPEIADIAAKKFVLFVSTLEHRKNHDMLYKALLRIIEREDQEPPLLVFAGRSGWLVQDLLHDLKYDPRVRGRIAFVKEVSEAELGLLYRSCSFTVFPSLYEGWGLPVSESLLHGKFVLASDQGSLPEACMGLCELICPYDTARWAERIMVYAHDAAALKQREAEIRRSFKPRLWTTFTDEMLSAAHRFAATDPAAAAPGRRPLLAVRPADAAPGKLPLPELDPLPTAAQLMRARVEADA